MARKTQWSVIGRGNNGAVIQGPPGVVYKYTQDPTEVACWLAAVSLGHRSKLPPGLPEVYDIHLGNRSAVITREDVAPLGKLHGLDSHSVAALQRAGRLAVRGRVDGHYPSTLRSRRWRSKGLYGPLRTIGRAVHALESLGATPTDLRPSNLGRRRKDNSLVLHDPGRTPVETTLSNPAPCPNARSLGHRVRQLLGTAPSYKSCQVVNKAGLRRVMRKHGWSDADADGTAGFHTQDQRILLAQDGQWSLLHELVHAAGVTDKDMAQWLTEGITEATAQEIAKQSGMSHRPTYDKEVDIVKKKLAPALGMGVTSIGKLVVRDPARAGRQLSKILAQRHPKVSWAQWYKTIGPGVLGPEPFIKLLRRAR